MDFVKIVKNRVKNTDDWVLSLDFKVIPSKDLMIRGKNFYAIWDEAQHKWSTDEYDVQRLIDEELLAAFEEERERTDSNIFVKWMRDYSSGSWTTFKNYVSRLSDNFTSLDEQITFLSDIKNKDDYISKRLSYDLNDNEPVAYNTLMERLYDPDERLKIEWCIGSVFAGESKNIQKFLVLYGMGGTGKSTVLNIIEQLFEGYYTTFEAKALVSNSNVFATEAFRSNPLVAIQHDGDLSNIEDNTKLNSIVSHEMMTMNEKYKSNYSMRLSCFLFMATNKPVCITDSKSGVIRRLIDVAPSGRKIPSAEYDILREQIRFELGSIATRCIKVFNQKGKNYYNTYIPTNMIYQTNMFFNYVEHMYFTFKENDGTSLSQAYDAYKAFCDESLINRRMTKPAFKEELKSYFIEFKEMTRIDGRQVRNYYSGFLSEKFETEMKEKNYDVEGCEQKNKLELTNTISILDDIYADCPAQYANEYETPCKKWAEITTMLSDLDTTKLHYVKPPINHIVIDFDLKDDEGVKSPEKNLEAASKFPKTYAEFSKGGGGIHLHYIYDGDVDALAPMISEGIEIKTFTGGSALRRRLTYCNAVAIAIISSGLPLKGARKMINFEGIKDETHLRNCIKKALRKEVFPNTKPSIDYINKCLEDAYNSGMVYDVSDLMGAITAFAANSTNNSGYCLSIVSNLKFESNTTQIKNDDTGDIKIEDLYFYDCEVFPNLFVACMKQYGEHPMIKMVNPSPKDMEDMIKVPLVGYNNRRYDNHIVYARYLGETNEQLFYRSKKIINKSKGCFFSQAYNISYTDIFDFSSDKKSLKKWEIELGLPHKECPIDWDKEVDQKDIPMVVDYCCTDVLNTEKVFDSLATDFAVRKLLSKLSGLSMNDTTNNHTAKIIFGDDPSPQNQFPDIDLSKEFPGYTFSYGKSSYKGIDPKEGGFAWSLPGLWLFVHLLDIESMHPTTVEILNYFGKYTQRFSELKAARLACKHGDKEALRDLLDGILYKILEEDPSLSLKLLAQALKIVINAVYGMTSAKFPNVFKSPTNIDNVVAKRGALFMIDLQEACKNEGLDLFHIKTDSVKIANASPKVDEFVKGFGKKYGYNFELEAIYDKMVIVDKANYVAHKNEGGWTATGEKFGHPVVFKYLFDKESPIKFEDRCETKEVSKDSHMYLDMNENLPEGEHNYVFVGKVGSFYPVKEGANGGVLLRFNGEKYDAVNGTKGFRWLESSVVKELGKEGDYDESYHLQLIEDAKEELEKAIKGNSEYDLEWFLNEYTPYPF